MLALMEGRFEEAEQLIAQARMAGERAELWNARVSERLQLFVLRRAQGQLAELEDLLLRSVHEYPTLLRFRCALANLYAETADIPAARSVLADLASHDLANEYFDAEWLFTASLLPDVYRVVGDDIAAARLYAGLLPHEHLYAHAPIEATFGSVARALGVLATTLRRFDDAERHFGLAIQIERRMRARPWLAHAQHELAAALLERGGDGDGGTARALIDDAVTGYRELGMDTWAARAGALRN
jgi:tetratricopeptide (TPR) repeat protein